MVAAATVPRAVVAPVVRAVVCAQGAARTMEATVDAVPLAVAVPMVAAVRMELGGRRWTGRSEADARRNSGAGAGAEHVLVFSALKYGSGTGLWPSLRVACAAVAI